MAAKNVEQITQALTMIENGCTYTAIGEQFSEDKATIARLLN